MKKVLLCSPFTGGDLFEHRWVTPPLGVWRIASYLNARGHDCTVYDQNDPSNVISFGDLLQIEEWDLIGFSVLTATIEYDMARIHEAAKLAPDALIVAGGSGAALDYQYVLDNSPVRVVITSEGEYPLLEICEDTPLQDVPGIVFKTPARLLTPADYWEISKDLDVEAMHADRYWEKTAKMYDHPDLNEINTFRLFTTNYCPLGCKFCTLTLWKKYAAGCKVPVVAIDADQVIVLIHRVLDAYPDVKQIFFVDDDFFLSGSRTVEFLGKVIGEKVEGKIPEDLRFICLTNINRITEENVVLMKDAGFKVLSIGVESTSQHVLDSLNKKQTVETIWSTTQLILDNKIKPYYTLLMFTPYGRKEDLLTDIKGFRRLSEMGVGLSLEPYLIPLPGTPLWEERVPESMRWVEIEGTDKRIRKGFAWLPEDVEVRAIFDVFEKFYPKYKKFRSGVDPVGHKEKNYIAGVILDCLEIILKLKFGVELAGKFNRGECSSIYGQVSKMKDMDVDIVGDVKESQEEFPH